MNSNQKYVVNYNNEITQIADSLIIEIDDKIYLFEKFEYDLIKRFDGNKSIDVISEELSIKYSGTYKSDDFKNFSDQLLSLGIIKAI